MRRDPRVMGLVLALVAAISGCEDDSGSAARLSPAVVWVGDQTGRFRLEGPNPVDYLRGDGHEVRLVADYAATIGGVPTQVVSVDGLGVDVTLTTSLPTGVFPLTITAGARTWRTEAALTVVADPIDSDAGLCPLAPDGCTAFACPTQRSLLLPVRRARVELGEQPVPCPRPRLPGHHRRSGRAGLHRRRPQARWRRHRLDRLAPRQRRRGAGRGLGLGVPRRLGLPPRELGRRRARRRRQPGLRRAERRIHVARPRLRGAASVRLRALTAVARRPHGASSQLVS
jgi:hypothetical protein